MKSASSRGGSNPAVNFSQLRASIKNRVEARGRINFSIGSNLIGGLKRFSLKDPWRRSCHGDNFLPCSPFLSLSLSFSLSVALSISFLLSAFLSFQFRPSSKRRRKKDERRGMKEREKKMTRRRKIYRDLAREKFRIQRIRRSVVNRSP